MTPSERRVIVATLATLIEERDEARALVRRLKNDVLQQTPARFEASKALMRWERVAFARRAGAQGGVPR